MAAACCRWPVDVPAVREASRTLDWVRFEQMVTRHRISALVWHALRQAAAEVPDAVAVRLKAGAQRVAARGLLAVAEMRRLQSMLGAAGIDHLFLKGPPLAMLAYGDTALKEGWDIDLLVDPARLGAAAGLLQAAGYRCRSTDSDHSDGALLRWHDLNKESVWHHPARNLFVELHTRVIHMPLLIPSIGLGSPRRPVPLTGEFAPDALADEEMFTYLCAHGTCCGWHRLKWLADLAAWLSPRDPAAVERLHRSSIRHGGGRSAAVALLLCRDLLGYQLPPNLAGELQADRWTRLLVAVAKRMMSAHGITERGATPLGFQPERVIHFLLLPGPRAKCAEAARQLMEPGNRRLGRLPRPLRVVGLPLLLPGFLVRQAPRVARYFSASRRRSRSSAA